MSKAKLYGDGRRNDVWIKKGRPEAAGDLVEHGGKADPALEPGVKADIRLLTAGAFLRQGAGFEGQDDKRQIKAPAPNTKILTCLEAVENLQVMSPGLRPILPRMGGCVGGNVVLPPVLWGTMKVMTLKSRCIVNAVVAKDIKEGQAERMPPVQSGKDPLPDVMTAFMAKMPQQRATCLTQHLTVDLTPGVIGFLQAKGDNPAKITGGQTGITAGADDVIGKTVLGIFSKSGKRDAQTEKRAEMESLGSFRDTPISAVWRVTEVRNGAIQTAGGAELGA